MLIIMFQIRSNQKQSFPLPSFRLTDCFSSTSSQPVRCYQLVTQIKATSNKIKRERKHIIKNAIPSMRFLNLRLQNILYYLIKLLS